MDDDESIAKLMDLAGDGVAVSYPEQGNPFQFSPEVIRGIDTPEENRQKELERDRIRKLSLLQRLETDKPKLPPCVTRATQLVQSSRASLRGLSSRSSSVFARAQVSVIPEYQRKPLIIFL